MEQEQPQDQAPQRRPRGRPKTGVDWKEYRREYYKTYYAEKKKDPMWYAEYLERQKEHSRNYHDKIKAIAV